MEGSQNSEVWQRIRTLAASLVSLALGILPLQLSDRPALPIQPYERQLNWEKESMTLKSWDPAVFSSEILHAVAKQTPEGIAKGIFKSQTYNMSAKALTAAYETIVKRYDSWFDIQGYQEHIPTWRDLEEKRELYQYTTEDDYPPHLKHNYPGGKRKFPDDVPLKQIHDPKRLAATEPLVIANKNYFTRAVTLLSFAMPDEIKDFQISTTFSQLEKTNNEMRKEKVEIWGQKNIGDRKDGDWYSDAVFAQQSFTGTNPVTIKLASNTEWVGRFKEAALAQKKEKVVRLLDEATKDDSLYVQDYSFIREAIGVEEGEPLCVEQSLLGEGNRYAPCAVALYRLSAEGQLHPLAIVTDYRGSMAKSVVIFNKTLHPYDSFAMEETDWPWRYAKTCVQVSDWMLHEVAIHLTNTHLIEESIIVATHRNIPPDHLLYRILAPHWLRTLSLNAGARDSLVPNVVVPICGLTETQLVRLINHCYDNFDFTGQYVPNDLPARGFPLDKLGDYRCNCDKKCHTEPGTECQKGCSKETCHIPCDPRFHNYAYARNIKIMWDTLRRFVKKYLALGGKEGGYASDRDVANDPFIQSWVREIRDPKGGRLAHFPEVKTLDGLIDVVTMCIHIAAPQHTAVNYLQEYYQSFVVSKPPALCAPMPKTLTELLHYSEQDLMKALPADRPREWLIASHVANLLSMKVADDYNIMTYATTVYNTAGRKKEFDEREEAIEEAALEFCMRLWELGDTFDPKVRGERKVKKGIFTVHSEELDDKECPYRVMDPVATAVSILI